MCFCFVHFWWRFLQTSHSREGEPRRTHVAETSGSASFQFQRSLLFSLFRSQVSFAEGCVLVAQTLWWTLSHRSLTAGERAVRDSYEFSPLLKSPLISRCYFLRLNPNSPAVYIYFLLNPSSSSSLTSSSSLPPRSSSAALLHDGVSRSVPPGPSVLW